jgi:hypothetical protein
VSSQEKLSFNFTFRYLDDALLLNNSKCGDFVKVIGYGYGACEYIFQKERFPAFFALLSFCLFACLFLFAFACFK